MAMMAAARLIGDIFSETAMPDVDMHEASAFRDDSADGRIATQGHHRGALRGAERAEVNGHAAVMKGVARVTAVAACRDLQRSDMSRKPVKYSPDGRLHAGRRRLRLETELSTAAMFESIGRRGQKD